MHSSTPGDPLRRAAPEEEEEEEKLIMSAGWVMHTRVTAPAAHQASRLCASTRRFFTGGDLGGGGGKWHHTNRFSKSRGCRSAGRGGWQWRTTRGRLDIAVRPETYREELDAKVERARAHFAAGTDEPLDGADLERKPKPNAAARGDALPRAEVFESARSNFRMRAEFRIWHEGDRTFYAMFDSDDPKQPVEVPSFPMGSTKINELMPQLLEEVLASDALRTKLFQVNFLTTVRGDALISMLYHRRLTEEWEAAANEARARMGVSIIGRSRKQKVGPAYFSLVFARRYKSSRFRRRHSGTTARRFDSDDEKT